MINEIIQGLTQAKETIAETINSDNVKVTAAAVVLAAIPAYDAAKYIIYKVNHLLDEAGENMSHEQAAMLMEPFPTFNRYLF